MAIALHLMAKGSGHARRVWTHAPSLAMTRGMSRFVVRLPLKDASSTEVSPKVSHGAAIGSNRYHKSLILQGMLA